jgi:two-component system, OmpR family, sensor kinase
LFLMSIRWRIAVAMAALLVVFAVALGAVVSAVVFNTLETYQRGLLEADAIKLQQLYASTPSGADPSQEELLGASRVAIYYSNGKEFPNDYPLQIPSSEIQAVGKTRRFWRSEKLIVLLEPLPLPPSKPVVLAVAASTEYINNLTARVQVAILIVTGTLVLLAVLGGYLLTQLGLRPLISVARQAQELSETNLKPLVYTGARDELGVLVDTLNRLVLRLNTAFAAQKTFLAEVAHELRTPVTAIEGYVRQAKRDATPESTKTLDDATRVAKNMTRLVSDLLQLSRGEVVQELIPFVVDAKELLSDVASEFNITNLNLPTKTIELLGDPDRLAQLLRNLTSNAVRAAGIENVQLELQTDQQNLMFIVKDQGAGIAPELLPRIFEKFVKGATSRGAGLGLAIVAQIAKAHGGTVRVKSELGQGTEFIVTLPLLEEE